MAAESATQAASLAPGFRFHPTDEELVRYYLRRKVCGKPFRFDAISDLDIYKFEPWDLPGMSRLKSRDLEWYFFSVLDKKHGNGSRTNRATDKGYWKTTGKDRAVLHRSRTVGMKKTLVYHKGRAPRGERSNWVMHEYKLVDEELEKAGIVQDAFVLCRVFQKSGSGPKNGEQYGAPFIEEEWEDDELVMVPGEGAAEELVFDDDAFLDGTDLEQILVADIPSEDSPLLLDHYGNDRNHAEESTEFIDDQKPVVDMGEHHNGMEQLEEPNLFNLPAQYYTERKAVKHEYIGESSNTVNPEHTDYLLDEEFLDAIHNPQFDGAFLETDDLSNPIEANAPGFDMLEEYLTFFDADDDNSQYLKMMGSETFVSDQALLTQEHVNEGTHQVATGILDECTNDAESSSKQEPLDSKSDMQYPFINRASCMLGSISAPPALAAEFPTKDVARQLNSALQPSSSIHVTAGIVHIRNVTPSGNGTEWSFSKHGNVNIVLSLDLPLGNLNSTSLLSGKDLPAISGGWFYLAFIWVLLILSMSFKIGTYIYTGKAS